MASVNKVILVGNLGRDPEVRYSPDGGAICNVSIATTSSWKDKTSGDRREETERGSRLGRIARVHAWQREVQQVRECGREVRHRKEQRRRDERKRHERVGRLVRLVERAGVEDSLG